MNNSSKRIPVGLTLFVTYLKDYLSATGLTRGRYPYITTRISESLINHSVLHKEVHHVVRVTLGCPVQIRNHVFKIC